MIIKIKDLQAKGFDVHVDKESIEIVPKIWMDWSEFKAILAPFGLHDAFIGQLKEEIH